MEPELELELDEESEPEKINLALLMVAPKIACVPGVSWLMIVAMSVDWSHVIPRHVPRPLLTLMLSQSAMAA